MRKIFLSILLVAIIIAISTQTFAFSQSSEKLYNGIDVSEWQGNIDFGEVARAGIEVVYIRASEGRGYVDPYFRENYEKAKVNGLRTGFYHFLTATNVAEAKEEAEKIKLVTTDETINKLAKYVHNVLGLRELNCNYDINEKKCRSCIKRMKSQASN